MLPQVDSLEYALALSELPLIPYTTDVTHPHALLVLESDIVHLFYRCVYAQPSPTAAAIDVLSLLMTWRNSFGIDVLGHSHSSSHNFLPLSRTSYHFSRSEINTISVSY